MYAFHVTNKDSKKIVQVESLYDLEEAVRSAFVLLQDTDIRFQFWDELFKDWVDLEKDSLIDLPERGKLNLITNIVDVPDISVILEDLQSSPVNNSGKRGPSEPNNLTPIPAPKKIFSTPMRSSASARDPLADVSLEGNSSVAAAVSTTFTSENQR